MVSELHISPERNKMTVKRSGSRDAPATKNPIKVSKKTHKAEREKLKRDCLNELFLELGRALESSHQTSGKATILCDSIRVLKDLFTHVENLKNENAALLTETHDVLLEKNELRHENTLLEATIQKLKCELKDKPHRRPSWNRGVDVVPNQHGFASSVEVLPNDQPKQPGDDCQMDHVLQATDVIGPVLVIPVNRTCEAYSGTVIEPSGFPSEVKRPHARYPSSSDSWPSQVLAQQVKVTSQGEGSSQ